MFDSKKHAGIITYFNQNYIKTNKIDKKFGHMLLQAEKIRIKSDYDDFYITSRKDAIEQYENAKEYVKFIEDYINKMLDLSNL